MIEKPSPNNNRADLESDPFLHYAVYVEKFDEKNTKIKIDLKVWEKVQEGIFNAFLQEATPVKSQLFEECGKKFTSELGELVFFPKSKFAQNFVIKTINDSLRLPGVYARRPKIQTEVSFTGILF